MFHLNETNDRKLLQLRTASAQPSSTKRAPEAIFPPIYKPPMFSFYYMVLGIHVHSLHIQWFTTPVIFKTRNSKRFLNGMITFFGQALKLSQRRAFS